MKKEIIEYTVNYKNGKSQIFYTSSPLLCYMIATIYAADKGWDISIKSIIDTETKMVYVEFATTYKIADKAHPDYQ